MADMAIDYRERPPAGWFVLHVCRRDVRGWDWEALMIDVDPDDLKHCIVDFPALFWVNPNDYSPGFRKARQCWVHIPGKHKSRNAASAALEAMMMATQH